MDSKKRLWQIFCWGWHEIIAFICTWSFRCNKRGASYRTKNEFTFISFEICLVVFSFPLICSPFWIINNVKTCAWYHSSSLWCTVHTSHAFTLLRMRHAVWASMGLTFGSVSEYLLAWSQWHWGTRLCPCGGWKHQGAATLLIIHNDSSKSVEKRHQKTEQGNQCLRLKQ